MREIMTEGQKLKGESKGFFVELVFVLYLIL